MIAHARNTIIQEHVIIIQLYAILIKVDVGRFQDIIQQRKEQSEHGTGGRMSRSNFNTFIYGRQVNNGGKLDMCGSKKKRKRIKRGK